MTGSSRNQLWGNNSKGWWYQQGRKHRESRTVPERQRVPISSQHHCKNWLSSGSLHVKQPLAINASLFQVFINMLLTYFLFFMECMLWTKKKYIWFDLIRFDIVPARKKGSRLIEVSFSQEPDKGHQSQKSQRTRRSETISEMMSHTVMLLPWFFWQNLSLENALDSKQNSKSSTSRDVNVFIFWKTFVSLWKRRPKTKTKSLFLKHYFF